MGSKSMDIESYSIKVPQPNQYMGISSIPANSEGTMADQGYSSCSPLVNYA